MIIIIIFAFSRVITIQYYHEKYIYSILARKERKERKKERKKEVTIHHTSLYPNTYMRQTILAHNI